VKKITIAALIIGAFATSAQAQSNVTIYGTVDAGIVHESGGKDGSVTRLGSGIASASRFGFRGNEDLGNGLAAVFTLEGAVRIDTGSNSGSSTQGGIFDRQAFVGLKSDTLGTVTLGRQYTPLYLALSQVADPFGAGYSGSAKNLFPSKNTTRTSNTVVYASPSFSGFSGSLAYSLGEQAGDSAAGRQIGAGLAYSNGPLNARLAYNTLNSDKAAVAPAAAVSRDIARNTLFAVNYDFIVAKAFFAYGKNEGYASSQYANDVAYTSAEASPSLDNTNILIGATVPVGPAGTIMASYIRKDDKTFNQDADQYAIGYSHALSKRTSAYATFAKIKNKNNASYTVGDNTEAGSGDKAISLGMRHTF
jgi:predicted porin